MNLLADTLNKELQRRKQKNQKFGVRAFALYLGIDPSALSKMLKGRYLPSLSTLKNIADKIGLQNEEMNAIRGMLESKQAHGNYEPFKSEDFENEIEPLHLIILEALRVPLFSKSIESLRKAMNLEPSSFDRVFRDLERMNFIATDSKTGRIQILRPNNTTIPFPKTSSKRRAIQKEFLNCAMKALEEVPFEARHNSNLTIAVPSHKIQLFNELVMKMKRRIHSESEKSLSEADSVYNFTFAIYPVVKPQM